MSRIFRALLAIVLLQAAGTSIALAQVTFATLHGTVTDTSGAVVGSATVTALNTTNGISTTANTDAKGYYIFPQLQIGGPYTITVEGAGFQKFQSSGLMLNLNDNREIDAALKIGATTEVIQVEAAAVQVETSDTQLKQVVSASTIEELPLLGRDASGLQKLAVGSMESSDRFGNSSANGSQTTNNSYLLDGTDINDGPLQNEGLTINPDALSEENIVTSTLNPEFARNSGAIINQGIKSGSNQIHGSGFEFYRDTFLNNGDYFSQTRPQFHQNVFGGTLGGPVLKDKLFGFVAYQGTRNRTGATNQARVFSSDQLTGNFGDDLNIANGGNNNQVGLSGATLPFAVGSCPKGETWSACFPNGKVSIPQSQWNPIALALIQKYYPAANVVTPSGANYYNFNPTNTLVNDQGVIRVDYHLSSNDTFYASTVFQSSPSFNTLTFGASSLPGFASVQAEHFKIFAADWTHTFNATTLNELHAGYYRFNFAAVEPATPTLPSSAGFAINPQVPGSAGLPYIGITGYSALGFSFEGPQPRLDANINASDVFTKVIGSHSLKLGANFEQFRVSNPFFYFNNGDYSFGGGGLYSSGDPVIDFVLGIPDSYSQTNNGFIDAYSYEYYAFVQDSWKITPDFTLNYGISWDSETPNNSSQFGGIGVNCWQNNSSQSKIFPGGPPGLLFPGDPGCNKAGGPTTKFDHFGPRIGFAWSPSSGPSAILGPEGAHNFAVRGGFGLYYNRDQEEGSLQNLEAPPFFSFSRGVQDAGSNLSPAFQNPYADVAGNGSISNPFPIARPTAGQAINWDNYAELDINSIDPKYSVPYVMNFNLNVQRQLPSNIVLQVGYVGSLGRRLVRIYEGDPITQAGHDACLADETCVANRAYQHLYYPDHALQPATVPNSGGIPWYLSVGRQSTNGSSNYNSLQISLQKATTHGLYLQAAYTYSHALDNASGYESASGSRSNNYVPAFEYLNYGDSDFDARHRLVLGYNYQIPLLHSMNDNHYLKTALGGWHFSGITTLQTGFPVTISDSGYYGSLYCDALGYYGCPDTPNTSSFHIGTQNPRASGDHYWFNNSVFSQETIGTFGNVKRNFFHGPGYNYSNLEVYKDIPVSGDGKRYIQLRLEAYNAFNHPNFAAPDSNFTDGAAFGQITSTIQSADVNGDPQPGRAIQLAGKFYF